MRLFGKATKQQERDEAWIAVADEEVGVKRNGPKGKNSHQWVEAQAGQKSSKSSKNGDTNDLDTQPFVATNPEFSKKKLLLWRLALFCPSSRQGAFCTC